MKLPRKKHSGFTLVEVVLAVGVIAFAFVTTMGLLPVGLNVSREAVDTTVVSHIYQNLSSQAQQTDFSRLNTLNAQAHYYDQQGKSVDANSTNSIYKAEYKVNTSTAFPSNQVSSRLATVSIYILATRGQQVLTAKPSTNAGSQKFNVLISDNGI